MKKIISLFSLFALLTVMWGCESHQGETLKQEQTEQGVNQEAPLPKAPPEHGGSAGNK